MLGTLFYSTLVYEHVAAVPDKKFVAEEIFVRSFKFNCLPNCTKTRYCLTWEIQVRAADLSHLPSNFTCLFNFKLTILSQYLKSYESLLQKVRRDASAILRLRENLVNLIYYSPANTLNKIVHLCQQFPNKF